MHPQILSYFQFSGPLKHFALNAEIQLVHSLHEMASHGIHTIPDGLLMLSSPDLWYSILSASSLILNLMW